ncbi:Sec-independent protein translocase protein TatB [Sphingomonas radiodurans]|uniref:Sec-independent protein translocase protein TatB n=1 Tax=Sphingomonas radiodurans TaxID=2890321 RepID=UPI001E543902|nr:Sec-independent protein translocase protein TatB [Sphingomonas radiodurans]WBH16973.1 Sec-independent protein translocase protein TatB [Sphingomonas radiodurans]
MLDFNFTEMAVVGVVALVVIGPKDLPKALRVAGLWVGKARGVARQFRSGFDEMIREAELADMEKKWQAENERIMREHSSTAASVPALPDPTPPSGVDADPAIAIDESTPAPVMVEKPVVEHADEPAAPDTASADAAGPDAQNRAAS